VVIIHMASGEIRTCIALRPPRVVCVDSIIDEAMNQTRSLTLFAWPSRKDSVISVAPPGR